MAGNKNSGRKPKPRPAPPARYCPICGQPITSRRRTCSTKCKQRAYRLRLARKE